MDELSPDLEESQFNFSDYAYQSINNSKAAKKVRRYRQSVKNPQLQTLNQCSRDAKLILRRERNRKKQLKRKQLSDKDSSSSVPPSPMNISRQSSLSSQSILSCPLNLLSPVNTKNALLRSTPSREPPVKDINYFRTQFFNLSLLHVPHYQDKCTLFGVHQRDRNFKGNLDDRMYLHDSLRCSNHPGRFIADIWIKHGVPLMQCHDFCQRRSRATDRLVVQSYCLWLERQHWQSGVVKLNGLLQLPEHVSQKRGTGKKLIDSIAKFNIDEILTKHRSPPDERFLFNQDYLRHIDMVFGDVDRLLCQVDQFESGWSSEARVMHDYPDSALPEVKCRLQCLRQWHCEITKLAKCLESICHLLLFDSDIVCPAHDAAASSSSLHTCVLVEHETQEPSLRSILQHFLNRSWKFTIMSRSSDLDGSCVAGLLKKLNRVVRDCVKRSMTLSSIPGYFSSTVYDVNGERFRKHTRLASLRRTAPVTMREVSLNSILMLTESRSGTVSSSRTQSYAEVARLSLHEKNDQERNTDSVSHFSVNSDDRSPSVASEQNRTNSSAVCDGPMDQLFSSESEDWQRTLSSDEESFSDGDDLICADWDPFTEIVESDSQTTFVNEMPRSKLAQELGLPTLIPFWLEFIHLPFLTMKVATELMTNECCQDRIKDYNELSFAHLVHGLRNTWMLSLQEFKRYERRLNCARHLSLRLGLQLGHLSTMDRRPVYRWYAKMQDEVNHFFGPMFFCRDNSSLLTRLIVCYVECLKRLWGKKLDLLHNNPNNVGHSFEHELDHLCQLHRVLTSGQRRPLSRRHVALRIYSNSVMTHVLHQFADFLSEDVRKNIERWMLCSSEQETPSMYDFLRKHTALFDSISSKESDSGTSGKSSSSSRECRRLHQNKLRDIRVCLSMATDCARHITTCLGSSLLVNFRVPVPLSHGDAPSWRARRTPAQVKLLHELEKTGHVLVQSQTPGTSFFLPGLLLADEHNFDVPKTLLLKHFESLNLTHESRTSHEQSYASIMQNPASVDVSIDCEGGTTCTLTVSGAERLQQVLFDYISSLLFTRAERTVKNPTEATFFDSPHSSYLLLFRSLDLAAWRGKRLGLDEWNSDQKFANMLRQIRNALQYLHLVASRPLMPSWSAPSDNVWECCATRTWLAVPCFIIASDLFAVRQHIKITYQQLGSWLRTGIGTEERRQRKMSVDNHPGSVRTFCPKHGRLSPRMVPLASQGREIADIVRRAMCHLAAKVQGFLLIMQTHLSNSSLSPNHSGSSMNSCSNSWTEFSFGAFDAAFCFHRMLLQLNAHTRVYPEKRATDEEEDEEDRLCCSEFRNEHPRFVTEKHWPICLGQQLVKHWCSFVEQHGPPRRGRVPRWAAEGCHFVSLLLQPRNLQLLDQHEVQDFLVLLRHLHRLLAGEARSPQPFRTSKSHLEKSRPKDMTEFKTLSVPLLKSSSSRSIDNPSLVVSKSNMPPEFQEACPDEPVPHLSVEEKLQRIDQTRDEALFKNRHIGSIYHESHEEEHAKRQAQERYQPLKFRDRWVRGRLIGKGTFGSVFEAINQTTKEKMAVKERQAFYDRSRNNSLDTTAHKYESIRANFLHEMDILTRVSHPNLVRFFGAEESSGGKSFFLFMELCTYGTLRDVYHSCPPEAQVRSHTRDLVSAIAYLHYMSIVHRDIKPANAFLVERGQKYCSVKLGDFGDAWVLQSVVPCMQECEIKELVGTVPYMAPEVVKSSATSILDVTGYGMPCDIWSLGCVVLALVTGQQPWPKSHKLHHIMSDLAADKLPDLPACANEASSSRLATASYEAVTFIKSCLQLNPKHRPTADQLRRDIFLRL